MSFHIIVSSVGILALLAMEWNRKTRKLLAHKSLILLMNMHSFWTSILCVSILINHVATLHNHLTMRRVFRVLSNVKMHFHRSPADLYVSAKTCMIRLTPLIVAGYGSSGSIFSQMAMVAERYRASNNLANYENSSISVGHLLNAAHVSRTLFIWYSTIPFY
ncbi:hypothetical protein PENTCL1PPCAC_16392, partial [Pristionchus entomophagus]